jgi:hypothetical protein
LQSKKPVCNLDSVNNLRFILIQGDCMINKIAESADAALQDVADGATVLVTGAPLRRAPSLL